MRLAGADRYGTAAAVAAWAVDDLGADPAIVSLARGDLFADALAAGVLAGNRLSVTLLTAPSDLSEPTQVWLESRAESVELVDVLGSPAAIRDEVWLEARDAAD